MPGAGCRPGVNHQTVLCTATVTNSQCGERSGVTTTRSRYLQCVDTVCRYCVDTGYRHWQTGSWQLVPGFLGAPGSGSAGEAVAGDTATSVYNTTCCEHNPGLFTAQLVVNTTRDCLQHNLL